MKRTWFIRVICLISILVLTLGNMPVMADEQEGLDEVSRNNAIPIEEDVSYETGYTGNYKIFVFDVNDTGYYRIFTEGNCDPYLSVYTYKNGELKSVYENDDYLNNYIDYNSEVFGKWVEGEKIYIVAKMSNGSVLQNFSVKISGIIVKMSAYYIAYFNQLEDIKSTSLTFPVERGEIIELSVLPDIDIFCKSIRWVELSSEGEYTYECNDYVLDTVPHYSLRNDNRTVIRAIITFYDDPHEYIYDFNIIYDDDLMICDNSPEYFNCMVDKGENAVCNLSFTSEYYDGPINYRDDPNGFLTLNSEQINPENWINEYSFEYSPDNSANVLQATNRFHTESDKEVCLFSFIYDENESIPINTGNEYSVSDLAASSSDQVILEYTPLRDGIYVLSSSDIGGNPYLVDPYVAVFDSDFNCIGCNDDIGNQTTPENLLYKIKNIEELNFRIELYLQTGETYYFAIPVGNCSTTWYQRHFGKDYKIMLEFDRLGTLNRENGEENNSTDTNNSSSESVNPGSSTSNNCNTSSVDPNPGSSAVTPTPAIPQRSPSAPAVIREPGVAGFVERLYTVALERPSDPAGKQDWIDAITLRGETGASCARGFLYSPEFLNKGLSDEEFVAVLYRTFFDREPDQAGFNAWVGVLRGGTSKEEVIEGFINSTEWANLCLFYGIRSGGTGVPSIEMEPNQQTINFATRLYTTCLGRSADQAGLMAWARQLANQRDTGTGAAHGFFFSSEFTGQNVSNGEFVRRLYLTFMDREPDQAGYDAWVAQLDGGTGREEVFRGFADSIEFARICASYGIIN